MNPESFILFEEDEYFLAREPSERNEQLSPEPQPNDDEHNLPSAVSQDKMILDLQFFC